MPFGLCPYQRCALALDEGSCRARAALKGVRIVMRRTACACMQALLQMESVKDTEFEREVLACLPATPWSISAAEISKRKDLRDTR